MVFNINIKNRVATHNQPDDQLPVCGNTGDTVVFAFDEEWDAHDQKTARFLWGGKYKDVEFTGNTCEVPPVSNTQSVLVGVFAGELPDDNFMLSSTNATIRYQLSTRCGNTTANPSSGANYTNEARGYATEAKAAAENAEQAASTGFNEQDYIDMHFKYQKYTMGMNFELGEDGKHYETIPYHEEEVTLAMKNSVCALRNGSLEMENGVLKIPPSFNGLPITVINETSLCGNYTIIGVIFPTSITEIKENVFIAHEYDENDRIKSVKVTTEYDSYNSVSVCNASISPNAFKNCPNLTNIYIDVYDYNLPSGMPWGAENATVHYLI